LTNSKLMLAVQEIDAIDRHRNGARPFLVKLHALVGLDALPQLS